MTTTATETAQSLPTDPDGMNQIRAMSAAEALHAFMETTGTDAEDAICDLLCNMLHLCDRMRGTYGDFDRQLSRAREHYTAETTPYTLEA